MCTNILQPATIEGCGKGRKGWFPLSGINGRMTVPIISIWIMR
jgi:hypothetical protein